MSGFRPPGGCRETGTRLWTVSHSTSSWRSMLALDCSLTRRVWRTCGICLSGGLFLALEPEPNAFWDLVFGQNASWWQAPWRAGDVSSLRAPEDWRAQLAAAG